MSYAILPGDLRAVLPFLPEASIGALVTDPPYELGFMGKGWDASGVAFDPKTWAACLRVMKPGAYGVAFGGTRTYHRLACAIEDAGFEIRDCLSWLYGTGFPKSLNGAWGGTALKPAWEPIILFRRPLHGTVAATHAAHGTGGLGIEATRIEGAPGVPGSAGQHGVDSQTYSTGLNATAARRAAAYIANPPAGRWPANVCLDEEAAEALDEQSGVASPKPQRIGRKGGHTGAMAFGSGGDAIGTWPADPGGGASRFFYVAKASARERERGCEALPKRTAGELTGGREEGSDGLNSPRAGAGRASAGRANHHPTVKPIALMRWLVRLIAPPGAIVLDPFCGSGSTGCAAVAEGREFLGVELTPEYLPIALARIAASEAARIAAAEAARAPCA